MHKTIATAALLISATLCLAQPPGITREMIERSLPLEGAPLAVPGPYKVASEAAFDSPGHLVFHPADLDAFPKKDSLPVMVWGNGGCAIDGKRYSGFLTTIASHGFLVVAVGPIDAPLPNFGPPPAGAPASIPPPATHDSISVSVSFIDLLPHRLVFVGDPVPCCQTAK